MSMILEESTIDTIEGLTLEAEMNVLVSLCECYEKQLLILEHSTTDDLSEFSVFQEEDNGPADSLRTSFNNEFKKNIGKITSIPKKVIGALINLFTKFVRMCRRKIEKFKFNSTVRKIKRKMPQEEFEQLSMDLEELDVKLKDGSLLITSRFNWTLVREAINNFDLTNLNKSLNIINLIGDPTVCKIDSYINNINDMCVKIEKDIIPKLNRSIKIYEGMFDSIKNVRDDNGVKDNENSMDKISSHVAHLKNNLKSWNKVLTQISNELFIVDQIDHLIDNKKYI